MSNIPKINKKNNPIFHANENIEILDEAYKNLNETLEEYIMSNPEIDYDELESFKELLYKSYLKKKVSYFINSKIKDFVLVLDKTVTASLKGRTDNKKRNLESILFYQESNHHFKVNG